VKNIISSKEGRLYSPVVETEADQTILKTMSANDRTVLLTWKIRFPKHKI